LILFENKLISTIITRTMTC